MMQRKRGIVCEKKKHYTIFLTEKGEFLRGIPLGERANIGDEVDFQPVHRSSFFVRKKRPIFLGTAMLAAVLLFFIISSLIPTADRVKAYVQLETDRAVEFGVNEKGKVIFIRHLNETTTEPGDDFIDWKGKPLLIVLESAVKEFHSIDGQVVITTIFSDDESEETVEKIVEGAMKNVQREHKQFSWEMLESTVKDRKKANKQHMSVRKFNERRRTVPPQEKKAPQRPIEQEKKPTQEKRSKETVPEQSKRTTPSTIRSSENEKKNEKANRSTEHKSPKADENKPINKQAENKKQSHQKKEHRTEPPAANKNVNKGNPNEVHLEQKNQPSEQQPPGLEKRPGEQIPPGLQNKE